MCLSRKHASLPEVLRLSRNRTSGTRDIIDILRGRNILRYRDLLGIRSTVASVLVGEGLVQEFLGLGSFSMGTMPSGNFAGPSLDFHGSTYDMAISWVDP